MTLIETLQWLTNPLLLAGGWLYLVSRFLGFKPAWFEALKAGQKLAVTLALDAIPPLLAFVVLTYVPAETLTALEPLWGLVSALVAGILIQQGLYLWGHEPDKEKKAAG